MAEQQLKLAQGMLAQASREESCLLCSNRQVVWRSARVGGKKSQTEGSAYAQSTFEDRELLPLERLNHFQPLFDQRAKQSGGQ